jgi:hypothetical protein
MGLKALTVLKACLHRAIKDIYVTGYSEDRGGFYVFSAMPWWYYIEFDNEFLCLAVENDSVQIQPLICKKIQCNFDIEKEDLFTIASIRKEPFSEIIGFDLVLNRSSSVISALGIELMNDDYIFFDALTWDGIKISNAVGKHKYLKDERFQIIEISAQG